MEAIDKSNPLTNNRNMLDPDVRRVLNQSMIKFCQQTLNFVEPKHRRLGLDATSSFGSAKKLLFNGKKKF
jgi:hypothetical protein